MSEDNLYDRVRFRGRPRPHPDAVVSLEHARFTVLTSRLLRLEWSETGVFEDRSTYAFPTRYAEIPPVFAAKRKGDRLIIQTDDLTLDYKLGPEPFSEENLTISLDDPNDEGRVVWHPGTPNPGNLGGTRRTLDRCDGDASLESGLLSRSGWALFDDTDNVIFGDDGWVGPRPDFDFRDWYFFGYGHDYQQALKEYAQFGGDVPLIPRFVLGGWWSRYWAYSEEDLRDLVRQFEAHDVPLDVFVIDMDWHTPHSWTGYTWNRELFPDPPAFLSWLHDKGLKVTLNLHPAEGVQSFEEIYPEFAEALGIDPESGKPVPFRIADKEYVKHYFKMLHHPMEEEGVDFWWMDWQQGEISEVKGLDPLPWINHLHFNDIKRKGVRPMLYSRWGGLGNHRYYIGFSGDTYVTWDSLQFQPYMTATASNVLYGWWSHDIGGHMGGATEPELYARWVQFGALSPVLRLHSTKDPRAERRPWGYPPEVDRAAEDAFRFRYRLIPYLYSMARIASDTKVSLCRPMYYENAEAESAYAARYQYYLGDQMIAAPLVFQAEASSGLAATDVWLPEGTWYAYDTLETYEGPGWVRIFGDLQRMPMLMKAGAILPLAVFGEDTDEDLISSGTTEALAKDALDLVVFPGEGDFRLYEDDGTTEAYKDGEAEWTVIRTEQAAPGAWTVSVEAVFGACDALPDRRTWTIHLMGSQAPERVMLDGEVIETWTYDAEAMRTSITVASRPKDAPFTLTAEAGEGIVAAGDDRNRTLAEADVERLLGDAISSDWDNAAAVASLDAANAKDAVARLGGPLCHIDAFSAPKEAEGKMGRVIVAPPADGSACGAEVVFKLDRAGERETFTLSKDDIEAPWILETPFGYDGSTITMRWDVQVTLSWQGENLAYTYASDPYFPSIHRWHALVYNRAQETAVAEAADADPLGAIQSRGELLEQRPEEMRNLREPYGLFFRELYPDRIKAEGPDLAAYLQTTIVSDVARTVYLEFRASGPVIFSVNGKPVEALPQETDPEVPAHFRPERRTETFQLAAGENALVVHTEAPEIAADRWLFGARVVDQRGEGVYTLRFE